MDGMPFIVAGMNHTPCIQENTPFPHIVPKGERVRSDAGQALAVKHSFGTLTIRSLERMCRPFEELDICACPSFSSIPYSSGSDLTFYRMLSKKGES
jgi:hypothetical protein